MSIQDLPTSRATSPKAVACPSCSGQVQVRAIGQTLSVVCMSCGSIVDVSGETQVLLSGPEERQDIQPAIALGTRGYLRGVEWEVIGFMQRVDGSGLYYWKEYLLFNPWQGFRWLTEFDGHWNYLVMTKGTPILMSGDKRAIHMGKIYDLFHVGKAIVTCVMGEFYWRVKKGEPATVRDYICPPEVLSSASSDQEQTWSLGEYLEPDAVAKAFNIKEALPTVIGVAPNQPSPYRGAETGEIYRYWWILSGVVIVLHFMFLALGMGIWSNFLVALGLLGGGPFVTMWMRSSFEQQRWQASDYSPHWTPEDHS